MTVTEAEDRPAPQAKPGGSGPVLDPTFLDELMERVRSEGLELTGPEGLLNVLSCQVLERALEEEMADHLGYERGDSAGAGSGNSRHGLTDKTPTTEIGPVPVSVPRDRNGSFDPVIVPKGARRIGGLSDMVISLFAKGMTTRDIADHLDSIYGTKISHETISKITDGVVEEIRGWQNRPLDEVYPVLFIDALTVKIRDGGVVRNKAAHLALGVDLDGFKHVLGVWLEQTEGAKFWLGVLTELRNRGIRDVFIVCADGLAGIREAIEATWPQATLQTCVVHLIRNSMRYVNYNDRKDVAAALKPIYTAPTVEAAQLAFDALADSDLGRRYPGVLGCWRARLGRLHPVPGLPRRGPPLHLHHQRHRVAELPAAQGHQEPRPLPQRRRRDQAALAGHPRQRSPTQRRPRPAPAQGPTRKRPPRPRLEGSPERLRRPLQRPTTPMNRRIPYTETLPGSRRVDPDGCHRRR